MQDLTITLIQPNPIWHQIERNLDMFTATLGNITQASDLVILPEMFTTGFTMEPQVVAEPMNSRTHTWMKLQAAKLNAVLCGSIVVEENGQYYNRFLWITPQGETSYYDKRHLFRMTDEHHHYKEGTKPLTIAYKGWKVRPLICYDLRFPVYARNKVNDSIFDYDILLYVANWPQARIIAWDTLLRARAMENYCFTIGVNRTGSDQNNIVYNGNSAVYSSKGEQICKVEGETAVTITLAQEMLHNYRSKFPAYLDADKFRLEDL